jgi:hypothetical protein
VRTIWRALRTVIFNHQVQVCLCFHSYTFYTHSSALIRQYFAEDLRVDRVEGLVKATAFLGIQLFSPHKLSWLRLSAGIFLAILEIQFPFFVEFWLLPLK